MEPGRESKPRTVVTVREAAERLGVSERTIYRRLKAGRLTPCVVSNPGVSSDDLSVIVNRVEIDNGCVGECQLTSQDVKQVPDPSLEQAYQHVLQTLEKRDTEIARMIECQHEMTQTIVRLQEQMFELTRLVIALNLERGPDADRAAAEATNKEREEGTNSLLRRWIERLRTRSATR